MPAAPDGADLVGTVQWGVDYLRELLSFAPHVHNAGAAETVCGAVARSEAPTAAVDDHPPGEALTTCGATAVAAMVAASDPAMRSAPSLIMSPF